MFSIAAILSVISRLSSFTLRSTTEYAISPLNLLTMWSMFMPSRLRQPVMDSSTPGNILVRGAEPYAGAALADDAGEVDAVYDIAAGKVVLQLLAGHDRTGIFSFGSRRSRDGGKR